MPLQPLGNKPPLFLIHPVGSTVFWYTTFIKYFYPDHPLYGIQDPGIDKLNKISFTCIEEMAEFYIKSFTKNTT